MEKYEIIKHRCDNYELIEFQNKNIFLIENFLDLSLCNTIIYEMDNKLNYNELLYSDTNNVECYCITNPYDISVKDKLNGVLVELFTTLKQQLKCLYTDSFSFYELRKVHGTTREHIDGMFGEIIQHPFNNSFIKTTRSLTIVVSLNDNYEEGLYNFPRQDFTIKMKKGSCLIFPPYWTHPHSVSQASLPRYIFSTWGLIDNIVVRKDNLNNILIL
jgi:hypothetical protein